MGGCCSSTLHDYVRRGDAAGLQKKIVNGADVNEVGEALHVACMRKQLECLNVLLKAKADVKATDAFVRTPLHVEGVKLLCKKKAPVNAQDRAGRTPLFLACMGGFHDCVKILLKYNAGIDTPDNTYQVAADYPRIRVLLNEESVRRVEIVMDKKDNEDGGKKKKSKKKKSKKPDDDDDDGAQKRRKKKSSDGDDDTDSRRKKKSIVDDDDNDEKPVRRKKKPVHRDDDDGIEVDEDEPKPRKGRKSNDDDDTNKSRSKKSKPRSKREDDDDDNDNNRSKRKTKTKSSSYSDDDGDEPKRKPNRRGGRDGDDDDDDETRRNNKKSTPRKSRNDDFDLGSDDDDKPANRSRSGKNGKSRTQDTESSTNKSHRKSIDTDEIELVNKDRQISSSECSTPPVKPRSRSQSLSKTSDPNPGARRPSIDGHMRRNSRSGTDLNVKMRQDDTDITTTDSARGTTREPSPPKLPKSISEESEIEIASENDDDF